MFYFILIFSSFIYEQFNLKKLFRAFEKWIDVENIKTDSIYIERYCYVFVCIFTGKEPLGYGVRKETKEGTRHNDAGVNLRILYSVITLGLWGNF